MNAIKVQFKPVGKKYYFSPGNYQVSDGQFVIVETIRGIELGKIVGDIFEVDPKELVTDLKPILRLATNEDIKKHSENIQTEAHNMAIVKRHVKRCNLEMKVVGCEYTLDRAKIIIYFEADGRIDFRELLKYLAEEFHVRIELRQIGSRDGAKIIGGLGPCGRPICCGTFINEFDNVSIKMAKVQNLSLNPQKISGTCGKLLCCIKHENEVYLELGKKLASIGDYVSVDDSEGRIISIDILNQKYQVKFSTGKIGYYSSDDCTVTRKKKSND